MITKRSAFGAILALAVGFCGAAQAQEWKPEQVTIVLPHGVGGGQDRLTREFGAVWEKYLGVPVIYENIKGASGRKGYDYFLRQPADASYVMSSNLASAAIMYKQQNPDWDWREVIHPLGIFGIDPGAFFARKDAPFDTMEGLIEYSKENPVAFGLAFWASPDNLVAHQVMEEKGAKLQVVPIGGGSDTVTAVLGGHVQAGFTKVTNIVKNDDMRFLAISLENNPVPGLTDDAPTVSEVVGKKTVSSASYRGINVHKELIEKHPEVAKWLSETLEKAKDDPDYIKAAKREGIDAEFIPDMDHDALMDMIEGYWDAFDRFGDIYEKG